FTGIGGGLLACDMTIPTLKGSQTLTAHKNPTVVCVNDVNVGNNDLIVLTGDPGTSFVFVVKGNLAIHGGNVFGKILTDTTACARGLISGAICPGNLHPSNVIYNVVGTGGQIAFSGGGGGADCCKAEVDGSIYAEFRNFGVAPGRINGIVCSERDIQIV